MTTVTLDDILHKKAKEVMLFASEIMKGAEMQVHISKKKWGYNLWICSAFSEINLKLKWRK